MTFAPAGRLATFRGMWVVLSVLYVTLVSCGGSQTTGTAGTSAASTGVPSAALTITASGGASAQVAVELATTETERELGLMFRDTLPEDRGMLFLFPGDQRGGFWMKNTRIPLTIAYLDRSGRVLELHDGKPFDETGLLPSQPYRYALEVNQGWFERHGLGVGATVVLPGDLPAAE